MKKIDLTEDEWRQRLTPEQYRILRKEGTERAFTSTLHEKKDRRFTNAQAAVRRFLHQT
jgi:peptide methionine sulfoxide reductase MsrB